MNKIKDENKKHLKLYMLTSQDLSWENLSFPTDIEYEIIKFPYHEHINNYRQKFDLALSHDSKYFFKLDEDIIFSNHVWDYIIENRHIVDQPDVMTLSPELNIGVPSCDLFIQDFFNDEQKFNIEQMFLNTDMSAVAKRWNEPEISSLNEFTINSDRWDYIKFQDGLSKLKTNLKGIHPIRFDLKTQAYAQNVVLSNITKFIEQGLYKTNRLYSSYFVNDICLYNRDKLVQASKEFNFDPYDEIPMNLFCQKYNLNHAVVRNAFAIHTYFAYVSRHDSKIHAEMYKEEHRIHDLILEKSKEIHHFDL